MIYLDHNATTPVDPEVSDAVFSALKRNFGNPSSAHLPGRKAKEEIEHSRSLIADFLGCEPDEIFFTSGGTESNNLALLGTALAHKSGHIITSAIEHPSVLNTCRHLASNGFEVSYVNADQNGIAKIDEIKQSIKKDTFLLSIMHSNNETGVLQPVDEISELLKPHRITLHVDAAQTIGKMPYSVNVPSAAMTTIVPHKFYGPKGIGALHIRKGTKIKPILFGAGHETGLRPGTENVPGIIGFAKACEIAKRDMDLRVAHTIQLRDQLLKGLRSSFPEIKLNGHETNRLPNTINLSLPGISSFDLVEKLNNKVAVSAGSACHAGKQTPSAVLRNMGLSDADALSAVRFSVGKDNTESEIAEAVKTILGAIDELKGRS